MHKTVTHRIPPLCLVLLLLAGGGATLTAEEHAKSSPISFRPTHAALVKKQSAGPVIQGENIERVEPGENATVATEPGKPAETKDLMARSTILSYAGYWTIVPKHAVIYVPALYRKRVDAEPRGTLLSWRDFRYKNRGWIYPQTVRFSDASGETSLSPETFKDHKAIGRVVVAVFQDGPISFRPKQNLPVQELTKIKQ